MGQNLTKRCCWHWWNWPFFSSKDGGNHYIHTLDSGWLWNSAAPNGWLKDVKPKITINGLYKPYKITRFYRATWYCKYCIYIYICIRVLNPYKSWDVYHWSTWCRPATRSMCHQLLMPRAEVQLRSRGQVPIALQDEAAPEEKRFSWSSRPRKWRALKTHCNQELADLYWLDILWAYGILLNI